MQNIMIALKLRTIKIKIKKYWLLPFSIWMYQTKTMDFRIERFYHILEIAFFKLNLLIC